MTSHSSAKSDSFSQVVYSAFDKIFSRSSRVLIAGVGLITIGFFITLWMNRRETQSEQARNNLYLAEKVFETEMKASKSLPESTVSQHFSQSIAKFEAVQTNFPSTSAAVEAQIKLGALYFKNKDFNKALVWYEKASQSASGLEKGLVLTSLGESYENLGKFQEAIQAYEKASRLGESGVKGDALLGIARCYEFNQDTAKARSTYDQIIKELPGTETSKTAEVYRALL